jgi:hypothetical protein
MKRTKLIFLLIVTTLLVVAMGVTAAQQQKPAKGTAKATAASSTFEAVEPQTRKFIEYYKTIRLTPEQEKIKTAALSPLKAVCCKDFSALTCCCPCNFSKSLWGMTHYLIAQKGYNAVQVQEAAKAWIAYVNPDGFSGDSCNTGGCNRPFAQNGCGGMDDRALVF